MPLDRLIPALDPNPLPAPYFVFKALLLVTLFLHLLAMNLAFGSALLAAGLKAAARANPERRWAADALAKKIPVFLPAAITLGVAPLLFLQVLYGQFFYSASILVGWPWFGVLVVLTVAYYAFYFASFRAKDGSGAPGWALGLGAAILSAIAFVYVSTMTLALTPGAWAAKYFADPTGWNLNLAEPTLVPRLLHFVLAAVAVGGLLLAYLGSAKDRGTGTRPGSSFDVGARTFAYATLGQLAVGSWFLMTLPQTERRLLMGGSGPATALWVASLALSLAAMAAVRRAAREKSPRKKVYRAAELTAAAVLFMVVLRDLVRDAYLAPYLRGQAYAVKTQWDVFLLFLVLFVGGIVLWVVMLRRFLAAPAPEGAHR